MNDIEGLLDQYRHITEGYATARANRTYLEEFKKSKLAILMKEAEGRGYKTSAAQEREALAHDDYKELLEGLKEAVESEERMRYDMRRIEMQIEVWRTIRADERLERKAYAA